MKYIPILFLAGLVVGALIDSTPILKQTLDKQEGTPPIYIGIYIGNTGTTTLYLYEGGGGGGGCQSAECLHDQEVYDKASAQQAELGCHDIYPHVSGGWGYYGTHVYDCGYDDSARVYIWNYDTEKYVESADSKRCAPYFNSPVSALPVNCLSFYHVN